MGPTKRFLNQALILGLVLLPLATGCTNKQGETESPVFITVQVEATPGSSTSRRRRRFNFPRSRFRAT